MSSRHPLWYLFTFTTHINFQPRSSAYKLRVSISEDQILNELPSEKRKDRNKSHSVRLKQPLSRLALARNKSLPCIRTWEAMEDIIGNVLHIILINAR